jgi:(S)-ureidoglycine aminohydrolase
MTMQKLGQTRSTHQRDHLLQTPDTFVRAPLPGMTAGTAIVHIAPAAGAQFTQYTAELDSGGILGATTAQRFFYVLAGAAELTVEGATHALSAGGYAYLPAGLVHRLHTPQNARIAVIEKSYIALSRATAPALLIGHESTITSTALGGDEDLRVCSLLPDDPAFDFAVNTMAYQPGAALSMVEVHVMEHGLLMLEGGGIYRLGDSWYPVTAGDFIWMAPYCPQWFGALGKQPTKYLIYKDWNRHPLA